MLDPSPEPGDAPTHRAELAALIEEFPEEDMPRVLGLVKLVRDMRANGRKELSWALELRQRGKPMGLLIRTLPQKDHAGLAVECDVQLGDRLSLTSSYAR